MTIGERILELINEKGFTQKEFSDITGIPTSTVNSWKIKKQNPGMDKLQIICDTLKISPYYLISGTDGERTDKIDYIRVFKTEPEYYVVTEFRKLDKGQKDRLIGYLEAIKEDSPKYNK